MARSSKSTAYGRHKMTRGVCIFGILALVTFGFASFRSEIEPEEMRNKSNAELETIVNSQAEDFATDKSHRALREYRASKGFFFACDGECEQQRHRWLQATEELTDIRWLRSSARQAMFVRERKRVAEIQKNAARDRAMGLHQSRIQERSEAREEWLSTLPVRHTPDQRQEARRNERRDAAAEAAVAAARDRMVVVDKRKADVRARAEILQGDRFEQRVDDRNSRTIEDGERQEARIQERKEVTRAVIEAHSEVVAAAVEAATIAAVADDGHLLNMTEITQAAEAAASAAAAQCRSDPELCWCKEFAVDYRGDVAVTSSGRTCQDWDSQSPHAHVRMENFPEAGTESNFCRNPTNIASAWCYTTDPDTRWELCLIPQCPSAAAEVAVAAAEVATAGAAAAEATAIELAREVRAAEVAAEAAAAEAALAAAEAEALAARQAAAAEAKALRMAAAAVGAAEAKAARAARFAAAGAEAAGFAAWEVDEARIAAEEAAVVRLAAEESKAVKQAALEAEAARIAAAL